MRLRFRAVQMLGFSSREIEKMEEGEVRTDIDRCI